MHSQCPSYNVNRQFLHLVLLPTTSAATDHINLNNLSNLMEMDQHSISKSLPLTETAYTT
jgi:hypothetical protein